MKIAILQFSTTNVPYLPYTEAINKKYCELSGYDYIIEKNDEKISKLIEDRAYTWGKPKIILENLENYDYVLFMDIDAIVCNFSIRIEEFIDEQYEIIAAEDNSNHSLMNAGILLIKNSEWSKNFMNEWWESGATLVGRDAPKLSIAPDNMDKVGYFKESLWHDQTCLTYLYENRNYEDKIKIISNRSLNWMQYKEDNFIFHAFCYGGTKYRTLNSAYYDMLNIPFDYDNKKLSEIADFFETDKENEHAFITNHYERIFEPIKNKVKKFCEIGVGRGGSLKLWQKFFTQAEILGLDASQYDFEEERITTKVIDASNPIEVEKFCSENKDFDVVLDDCTHKMHDQQMCFAKFFKSLNPGGIYIIEDLHTSVEVGIKEKENYNWGDPSKITTLDLLKNFIENKKINTDYILPEDAKYLEDNIESCEILYRPGDSTWSITSLITKSNNVKSNNVKSNNVKSNNVKSNNVKSNNVKSNNVKSNNVKSNNVKSNNVKSKVTNNKDLLKEKIKLILKQKYKGKNK